MPWRKKQKAEASPLRLLLWTAIAGLIFGLVGFGELPEDLLRASRNSLHWHKASGDIVVVKLDDRSMREVGRWPWSRERYAQLTDKLAGAGARRIFFDTVFDAPTDPAADRAFAESLKQAGNVTLAATTRTGLDHGRSQQVVPLPLFRRFASLGSVSVPYNYQDAVWRVPYAARLGAGEVPSFSAKLAGVTGTLSQTFTPDYSLDPATIPSLSAGDVINGRFDPAAVRGKDLIIGVATDVSGDEVFVPGTGRMGGVFVHVIGAETLKAGKPVDLGWIPLFVISLAAAALAALRKSPAQRAVIFATSIAALLFVPALFEARLVKLDITPGLFVLLCVASVLGWRSFRRRGLINPTSGLPNLNAFSANSARHNDAIVVARIINYAEIVAALPSDGERELVEQAVARLRVGSPERELYQGDGGIFAWFEEPRLPFTNHVEALHALFRNPARIAGQAIDLAVSFGIEIGSSRSLPNRLASAIVAAEEAAHDGLKWKYHDPESLENASWKLSMLGQLDAAVEKGEIWVAYQPKLDLATGRVIGAEALARWTHPEKGPIAASEFIAAAEQHDRIGKLTDFVLEQAIRAAVLVHRKQPEFGMAVNLSARLLDDRGFLLRLRAMLARHGLPPEHLTLELTETAALADNGAAVEMLAALRELGVAISIDDYGTGLSTLDYLKKIPASEIKIDQSFVKGMLDNRSDLVMVQSTIALAHSLGRKVVAEGVERREVLEALVGMKCDVAQGYVIGRPGSIDSILKRISTPERQRVA